MNSLPCCTFRRPHSLGELIESFLRQDYVPTGGALRRRSTIASVCLPGRRRPRAAGLAGNSARWASGVGVRTGASFVKTGETGLLVDRLPPGRQCVETDDDERALGTYVDAIDLAESMDRDSVRHRASEQFATAHRRPSHRCVDESSSVHGLSCDQR